MHGFTDSCFKPSMEVPARGRNVLVEKAYYFTDDGQLRFFRETRENVVGDTIIELDANEHFVSWVETCEEPEDGLGWVLSTYTYDENGKMLDRDYVF